MTRKETARLLVVDIGNTSTAFGVYEHDRIVARQRLDTVRLTPQRVYRTGRQLLASRPVTATALASVCPSATDAVREGLRRCGGEVPVEITSALSLGVPLTYPDPRQLGADRLANVAGAVALFPPPGIVVDIGTATTFDVIRVRKGYCGGVIAPGPALLLDYMAEKTALLPRVELVPIRACIGTDTAQAMQIGAWHGYRGMVLEIIHQIMKLFGDQTVTLCATGGYAQRILEGMPLSIRHEPDLTLLGIATLATRSSSCGNP